MPFATLKGVTVVDNEGNYNIYINHDLSYEEQKKTYEHEKKHINRGHFDDNRSIDEIEKEADKK